MEKAEAKKTAKLPKLSLPKKKKHVETAPSEPAPLPVCEVRPFDKKDYRTLSLLLNGLGVLLFILSPQPYGAALLFLFLAIKVIILMKKP